MKRLESVERARGGPARIQIYAALRSAIVRGDLSPGAQLSENALSAEMGVSRTPIREALARLRDDRLIEIVPQLGTFVARISDQAVSDAQFIREALECAAVRLTAEIVTEENISELESNLEAQARAVTAEDYDAFYLLDDAFHRDLTTLSGHQTIWSVSERAEPHLNRVRRLTPVVPGYLDELVAQHRTVLTAVADHDADRSEASLRHHHRMVLAQLSQLRRRHPDFFDGV